MPKMFRKYTESSIPIDHGYLSPADERAIDDYTMDIKGGYFYGVNLNGEIGTIAAGTRKVSPGYHFTLSKYPFYRLVYTISGKVTIKMEKKQFTANTGSIYYFIPRQTCTVINNSPEPWTHIYIHFTGSEVAALFKKILTISDHIVQIQKPIEIQTMLEQIVNQCISQNEDSQIISDNLMRTIMLMLPSSVLLHPKHLSTARNTYLECYNFIKNNFAEIKTIEDIAENCCIDKAYLCRLFKRYADTSPMAYVTKLKMNKAALLLIQTNYSIKQISTILNFENQYYFSHVFKKIYTVSPKHFREKA